MKKPLSATGLVYSTDAGRMCPDCRQPTASCSCRQNRVLPVSDGTARVSRQTRGRGGKTVTLVSGLPLGEADLARLGKQLKAACGSGGTVKDGVIEVQGDHCVLVLQALHKQGYVAKRAGGWCLNPDDLLLLLSREMPYGKYKGRLIADLPGHYLNWFARDGFPKGEIGRLLALMQEIDHNGLSSLLDPLRRR